MVWYGMDVVCETMHEVDGRCTVQVEQGVQRNTYIVSNSKVKQHSTHTEAQSVADPECDNLISSDLIWSHLADFQG